MKKLTNVLFLTLLTTDVSSSAIDWDVVGHGDEWLVDENTYCMALNIYHESRSENLAGKFAVADVVMNRVYDRRYPHTICSVIYQAEMKPSWKDPLDMIPVRNRCQFSWFCDGKSDEPAESDAWNESLLVAHQSINEGRMAGITEGATHYHTTSIEPYWASSLNQIGTIGSHIFYRAD
ncbi:MAG: cell wall hydrolase [Methylophagaceae bacterium]